MRGVVMHTPADRGPARGRIATRTVILVGQLAALLGFVQCAAAGTIAPLARLGGENAAVPMARLMIARIVASMIGLTVLARPTPSAPSVSPAQPGQPRKAPR